MGVGGVVVCVCVLVCVFPVLTRTAPVLSRLPINSIQKIDAPTKVSDVCRFIGIVS